MISPNFYMKEGMSRDGLVVGCMYYLELSLDRREGGSHCVR